MTLMLCGKLSEPAVRTMVTEAFETPDKWQIYLVKTDGRERTPAQNKFFRVLLRKMAQQQGRSVKYWHDFLVEKFLGFDEVVSEDGYTRLVLCSTAELTMPEFSQFLNACLTFAIENQVELG